MVQFIPARTDEHKLALLQLSKQYMSWIAENYKTIHNIDIFSIVGPLDKFCERTVKIIFNYKPPKGETYLIQVENEYVGMGSFRRLDDEIVEFKRLFVDPQFRGKGLGSELVSFLLEKAKAYSYSRVYLETASFMESAQHIYRKFGFVQREEYTGGEVPPEYKDTAIFLQKEL